MNVYKIPSDITLEDIQKVPSMENYEGLALVINLTTPVDQIRWNFSDIEDTEKKLKKEILKLMGDSNFQPEINKAIRDNFELYLSKDWKYFGGDTYKENNLEILFAAMNDYAHLLNRGYFLLKKNLLDYQITLINPQIPSEMISSSDG